jgi:hypothetical protein
MKSVLLIALALPLLSACIFFEGPEARAIRKSPNYKQGYEDGCATVSSKSANYREQTDYRDRTLFKTDKAYRSGWSAGYTACRPVLGNEEPQNGPVPDPYQRR